MKIVREGESVYVGDGTSSVKFSFSLQIVREVYVYMMLHGVSQSALARRCGIPQPTIHHFIKGTRWIGRETLDTIAKEIGIEIASPHIPAIPNRPR